MIRHARDIPDAEFLHAVRITPGVDGSTADDAWRMRWQVRTTLQARLGEIPEKVFLAKARRLMRRNQLGGCGCGCRGDYHLPAPRQVCCDACESLFPPQTPGNRQPDHRG